MKELVQFNKKAVTEITFYKWVRKANFYQKIETTKSTEEIVELICEITTSNFSVHVPPTTWKIDLTPAMPPYRFFMVEPPAVRICEKHES